MFGIIIGVEPVVMPIPVTGAGAVIPNFS